MCIIQKTRFAILPSRSDPHRPYNKHCLEDVFHKSKRQQSSQTWLHMHPRLLAVISMVQNYMPITISIFFYLSSLIIVNRWSLSPSLPDAPLSYSLTQHRSINTVSITIHLVFELRIFKIASLHVYELLGLERTVLKVPNLPCVEICVWIAVYFMYSKSFTIFRAKTSSGASWDRVLRCWGGRQMHGKIWRQEDECMDGWL